MMVNVYFMRYKGRRQPYGYIADVTNNYTCDFVDPFFIVQADEAEIPKEILANDTVRLNLPKLQKRHPDTTEQYKDENGDPQERIVYGYFSEYGRSTQNNPPVITMEDVLYE